MKKNRIIYWTTTGIVCAVMTYSAINFSLSDPLSTGSFAHLRLPDYFKVELTIAKILGVLALLVPNVPPKIKEFAYFGFAITLISASIAHYSVGDGILNVIDPLLFLAALIVSYLYFRRKLNQQGYRSAGSETRSVAVKDLSTANGPSSAP
jgi:hypothetical protein